MTKNTIFTIITITIIVIGWLAVSSETPTANLDPIPICPVCKRGTVREKLESYALPVDNPEIYSSTGKRMSGYALIDISTYKCYSCRSTYSWYHHYDYGNGYYTDGMKFEFFREEE